jgi:ribosomal protein S18 acetylase RimI-like enzyme
VISDPPERAPVEVRVAQAADAGQLAVTLARAFGDDPLMRWMLPPARRHQRAVEMFSLLLAAQLPLGSTYTAPGHAGAALWTPPGRRLDTGAMAQMNARFPVIFGPNLERALSTYLTFEEYHPASPEHWYLGSIGTHPDWQGRGIGAALLTEVLTIADQAGQAAYLESSKEVNIGFYERFGFVVTGKIELPDGPCVWPMWREPGAAGN